MLGGCCTYKLYIAVILNIPSQYPKGLGSTVAELDTSSAVGVFPKTKFSMLVPEVEQALPGLCEGNLKHVILFGIEASTMEIVELSTCIFENSGPDMSVGIEASTVSRMCKLRSSKRLGAQFTKILKSKS